LSLRHILENPMTDLKRSPFFSANIVSNISKRLNSSVQLLKASLF